MDSNKKELDQPAYTVEALLHRAGFSANSELYRQFSPTATVEGTVQKVRNKTYKGCRYFELSGAGAKITVQCPLEYNIRDGERLVVTGTLSF